jgi:hypothetical protein
MLCCGPQLMDNFASWQAAPILLMNHDQRVFNGLNYILQCLSTSIYISQFKQLQHFSYYVFVSAELWGEYYVHNVVRAYIYIS